MVCFRFLFVSLVVLPGLLHAQRVWPQVKEPASPAKIMGRVVDGETGDPLAYVNIAVLETSTGTASGATGEFTISGLPIGTHTVRFSYLGYTVQEIALPALENPAIDVTVELSPEPLSFKEIVVTPGVFSIMGTGPTVRQSLTREDLETVPFGEDIYRATTRLPGISGSDFSAKFTVRGGENEEVLVMFDGLELYDPFHLKDIEGGALSVIDVAAVEGIDLMTGGFPVQYGDRMSGVFNMRSVRPSGRNSTSVGLSMMNARVMSQGSFGDNRGQWLVSGRRGYLDLVLDLMGEEDPPRPVYYDFLTKLDYQVHPKHRLTANALYAHDGLDYIEDDDDEDQTSYQNGYVWATLKSTPSKRLFIQTLASYGHLMHDRNGTAFVGPTQTIDFTVADRQTFDVLGVKQDWSLDVSDQWLLKWGVDLKHYTAAYDYFSTKRKTSSTEPQVISIDTTDIGLDPSGATLGVYASSRFQPARALTVEPGLRYDHNSFTGDDLFSPRLNAAYALGRQTFVRGGWGYFYQSERIHEIRVSEGERAFERAQLAKHWVAGFEHTFRNGYNVRVEGYYRDESRLRPDYRNFDNSLEIFPELQDDRFKLNLRGADAKGVEVYFKYDRGGKWTWWSSYSLAYTNDDVGSLVLDGVEYTEGNGTYPGKNDQRHTAALDLNYRPSRNWRFNASWHYRSGWPYTPLEVFTRPAPDGGTRYYAAYSDFHGARYPAYHRLDVSVNRYFRTSRGTVALFLSIINLYNHGNVRDIEYEWRTGPFDPIPTLAESNEYWFKLLPSIGISWSLDH